MSNWRNVRLKDLCVDAGQYGLNISAESYVPSGLRLLRTTDISSGVLAPDESGVFVEAAPEARFALAAGDLLLSRSGTPPGQSYLVRPADAGMTFAGYLVRFRPRSNVDPRFLSYVARSTPFQHTIHAESVASTIQNFNAERYANISFAAPDFNEQGRIADFLDARTEALDTLTYKRRAQLELLRQRRFSAVREVLCTGLGGASTRSTGLAWLPEIPEDWDLVPLRYLTVCLDGKRVPLSSSQRADRRGPYPYHGASRVVDHVDDYLFDEPLVLLGEDGAQLGNPYLEVAFYVEGKIWVNNHAHVLKPTGIDGRYLAEVLNVFDRNLYMSGSTREKITQDEMNRILVPVPPPDQQEDLVEWFSVAHGKQRKLEGLINTQMNLLTERRQALITAAVTGQFEVSTASGRNVTEGVAV
ncbi:restriction endonuclease subunit S [Streptomyces sp. NPDC055058]